MSGKIYLNGHIDVPVDQLEAVSAALTLHIELTHEEPGCISFDVNPCPEVPGRFLVSECFVDQKAFEAHQARTKSSAWAEVTKDIPRSYEITTEE